MIDREFFKSLNDGKCRNFDTREVTHRQPVALYAKDGVVKLVWEATDETVLQISLDRLLELAVLLED